MLKVLTTGASGMLGRAVYQVFEQSGCEYFPLDTSRAGCDFLQMEIDQTNICDREAIVETVSRAKPDVVINCAAMTDVDGCETNRETAFAVNGEGAGNVAAAARAAGALMVHVSTDYVFDGWKGVPYKENDITNPQSVYGASKLAGEKAVMQEANRYMIIRTAWLYGAGGKNFIDTICRVAQDHEELKVVNDQTGSPTYTVHLATAIANMVKKHLSQDMGKTGFYHVTGSGFCTWFDLAKRILRHRPGVVKKVIPVTTADYGAPAPRPRYSVLSNDLIKTHFGIVMPHWEDALAEYLD